MGATEGHGYLTTAALKRESGITSNTPSIVFDSMILSVLVTGVRHPRIAWCLKQLKLNSSRNFLCSFSCCRVYCLVSSLKRKVI